MIDAGARVGMVAYDGKLPVDIAVQEPEPGHPIVEDCASAWALQFAEMRKTVRFTYHTGIARQLFDNPVLVGSWDGSGRYSEQWSEVVMTKMEGPDGCPAFTATA